MKYLINSIKFNILKARLTKLFLVKNARSLGIVESLAVSILACPKLFLKKRALLLSNKFITFDVLIVCYSYACRMLYRNFVLSAEPILLTLIYRGANKLYKLKESDVSDIAENRIKVFYNIFFENEKHEAVIDKAIQEACALFSHDLYTDKPTHYGTDTPLTVLPINVYTNLEVEANNYLRPMFLAIDNLFINNEASSPSFLKEKVKKTSKSREKKLIKNEIKNIVHCSSHLYYTPANCFPETWGAVKIILKHTDIPYGEKIGIQKSAYLLTIIATIRLLQSGIYQDGKGELTGYGKSILAVYDYSTKSAIELGYITEQERDANYSHGLNLKSYTKVELMLMSDGPYMYSQWRRKSRL